MKKYLCSVGCLTLVSLPFFTHSSVNTQSFPPVDTPKIHIVGDGKIYSNGEMQLEVKVDIRVLHSKPQLNWVKLYTNDTTLPEPLESVPGWVVSDIENEYVHYIANVSALTTKDNNIGSLSILDDNYERYRFWVSSDLPDQEEICAVANYTYVDFNAGGEIITEETSSCRTGSANALVSILSQPPVYLDESYFTLIVGGTLFINPRGTFQLHMLRRQSFAPQIIKVTNSGSESTETLMAVTSHSDPFLHEFYHADIKTIPNSATTFLLDSNIQKDIKYVNSHDAKTRTRNIPYLFTRESDPMLLRHLVHFEYKAGSFLNADPLLVDADDVCWVQHKMSANDFESACIGFDTSLLQYFTHSINNQKSFNDTLSTIVVTDQYGTDSVLSLTLSNGKLILDGQQK
ncbi:hypothetical protein [Psychromonas sp. Urea-02u-13]|uniref:hypothetical protein n=1 Tax=Psychromonas sp. Urea-02u-13 TaxID=2058326 RepID=UPI000C325399|nr:hypothetical protein [Psychromonas sp. Urea-02u-13]PKG37223.1 hypothetical protein CXF74_19995 [Psychromonas sp. Urea-02u-13]